MTVGEYANQKSKATHFGDPGGFSEASWSALETSWGLFQSLLRPLEGIFRSLETIFEPYEAVLGAVLGVLGGGLGACWGVLGPEAVFVSDLFCGSGRRPRGGTEAR